MASPYVPTRFVNGIESGSEEAILPVVTYDAGIDSFVDSTTDLPISSGISLPININTETTGTLTVARGGTGTVGDSSGNIIANVVPRSNTLANLESLTTGGTGELAYATDAGCYVILQNGATSTKTLLPMSVGTWVESTKTLKLSALVPASLSVGLSLPSVTNSTGNGGPLEFNAVSTSFATGTGGNLSFVAGDSSGASSGNAGLLRIRAGNVISSSGNAGPCYTYAGDAQGSGNGGNAAFSSGFAASGNPGFVAVYPGYNNTSTGVGYLATSFAADNYHEPTTIAAGEWAISWSDGGVAASPKVGFLGTTAIVKPTVTGSRATGAALVSLLTALANLGLIINSTSA